MSAQISCNYCDASDPGTCRMQNSRDYAVANGTLAAGSCELRVTDDCWRLALSREAAEKSHKNRYYAQSKLLESLLVKRCFDL